MIPTDPARMTRGTWLNVALLVVVAALATIVAFKPRDDAPPSERISSVRADRVRDIRLERKGDLPIHLERRTTGWHITAPLAARADPFQVERLLAVLDAQAIQRLPARDLARYGLDDPLTRIVFDGTEIRYGSINAVTREQYLLSGNAVQVVAARYGALIPANLTQLLRKALFDAGEAPVRLEFSNFTVSEDGKGWRIEPPLRETPSQDDLNRWIDDWRQASALRVEPYAGDGATDTMRVAFRSGKVLALDVIQKQPELILGRADQKLRYYFAAPVSARLLSPPGAAH